jgi:hypothetical protein
MLLLTLVAVPKVLLHGTDLHCLWHGKRLEEAVECCWTSYCWWYGDVGEYAPHPLMLGLHLDMCWVFGCQSGLVQLLVARLLRLMVGPATTMMMVTTVCRLLCHWGRLSHVGEAAPHCQ